MNRVLRGLAAFLALTSLAADGRDTAHYTADNLIDFQHMRLELTFTAKGMNARTCEGRVEYTVRPRAEKIDAVRLDAVDMRILGVELPGATAKPTFSYDDKVLTVPLPQPAGAEKTFKLAVKYRLADPPKGMHFILPTASAPKKPVMVYTMSEPLEARYWVPTHDWPNARWTSDILVTVPHPYRVVANGVVQAQQPSADGKAVTFHWHNAIPTDPHLMGLAIGELVELRDSWRGKPVLVYTQPGAESAARYTFRRVPEILELYTHLTGVDYPYPGYAHVTVVDHHHGGMEHASFSFVDPRHIAASDDADVDLERTESVYISHMLAHQWFGGIVNYRSVSQAWLNEGFAILLDSIWTGHTDSPHRFPCKMWETAQRIAATDSTDKGKPMVNRDLADLNDIYLFDGSKVYYKGAWVLQMLRHQLGEELFWRGVAKYLNDHRWQSVETSDLRRVLEEVSGRDLEQFFQQWVYGHGVPRLVVDYSWDAKGKQARVIVRQTQKIDKATPAFAFPLDLYFRSGDQEKTVTVQVTDAHREWTFDWAAEPTLFCVDPRGGLLKTLVTNVPRAMRREQALHGPTALARLMAVSELGQQPNAEAVEVLEQALTDASEFWMVRQAAARRLARQRTEPALKALLCAEKAAASHPRVLAAVVEGLPGFAASPEAQAIVLKYADPKSPREVETAAVSALARMRASPAMKDKIAQVLQAEVQQSARRPVRRAALQGLSDLDDPRAYDTVLALAQPGRDDELRGQAIASVGRLGRRKELRERTRRTLTAWLDDTDPAVQVAAATALGALGDPRSLADLTALQEKLRKESDRQAVGRAIETLKRPPDSAETAAALLERLDALEKRNEELEKRLKALGEQLEAAKAKTRNP
jgi:aminopeptidase N